MRKMMSIKKIDSIDPIENADAIEVATIGGWKSVVKKGEFKAGQPVLYFEIDAFLPADVPEFAFLSAKSSKDVTSPNGQTVRGHVLRTMKLRGVFSQGLILPLGFGLNADSTQSEVDAVAERLGVFKFEPPIPMGGQMVAPFPHGVRKTDSERVQNLSDEFLASLDRNEWFATEKVDGTSSTFLKRQGEIVVAGRNWTLHPTESMQAKMADRLGLAEVMPEGAIIQGEIVGEGIQGNKLKIQGNRLLVFSASSPVADEAFDAFVEKHSVPHLDLVLPETVEQAVEQVNGMTSTINPKVQAEGVVWWNREGKEFAETGDRANFKAINNKFLAKHGE